LLDPDVLAPTDMLAMKSHSSFGQNLQPHLLMCPSRPFAALRCGTT
jgi:hypothetical protein